MSGGGHGAKRDEVVPAVLAGRAEPAMLSDCTAAFSVGAARDAGKRGSAIFALIGLAVATARIDGGCGGNVIQFPTLSPRSETKKASA